VWMAKTICRRAEATQAEPVADATACARRAWKTGRVVYGSVQTWAEKSSRFSPARETKRLGARGVEDVLGDVPVPLGADRGLCARGYRDRKSATSTSPALKSGAVDGAQGRDAPGGYRATHPVLGLLFGLPHSTWSNRRLI
jgi:hypothetical protein